MSEKSSIPWQYFKEEPEKLGWGKNETVWNAIDQVEEYTAWGIVPVDGKSFAAAGTLSITGKGKRRIACGEIQQIVTVTGDESTADTNKSGVVINISNEDTEGFPMRSLIFNVTVMQEFPRPGFAPKEGSIIQVSFGPDYKVRRAGFLDNVDDEEENDVQIDTSPEVAKVLRRMKITSPATQQLDPEATLKALIEQVASMKSEESDENANTKDMLGCFSYRRTQATHLDGYKPLILKKLDDTALN